MRSHQPGYTGSSTNGAVTRSRTETCSEVSAPYGNMGTLKKTYLLQRTSPEMRFTPYTGFRAQCLKFYICLLFLNFVEPNWLSKDFPNPKMSLWSHTLLLAEGRFKKMVIYQSRGQLDVKYTVTAFPLNVSLELRDTEGCGFCSYLFNFGCVCF